MNVLNEYSIEFRIVKNSKFNTKKWAGAFQKVPSTLNYFICAYLEEMPIGIIQDDVLVELNKAVNGQSFDEDGGGFETFLDIGSSTSTFSDTNANGRTANIPTQDIRDILEAWIEWVSSNNLEADL